MEFEQLKLAALALPLSPGVYIMKDSQDTVIYVGKAKKLKNRVSQYFQDTASHSAKTRVMVSKIDHFDVITAASEFEALILECSLIKRHQPRYNILLKDGKGYPYIRLDMKEEYPRLTLANKAAEDGAGYYGPYGSRGVTNAAIDALQSIFKLPTCSKKFPRDIGKGRPCLQFHMDQCSGWCQKKDAKEEYRNLMLQVIQLLQGNYKVVASRIQKEMLAASDNMNFEMAAQLRDRFKAVESLGKKQLVTANRVLDMDVIGFAAIDTRACFTVLHYSGGNLVEKDINLLRLDETPALVLPQLLKQYYCSCQTVPKVVILPFQVDDCEVLEEAIYHIYGKNVRFIIPCRGEKKRLIELAEKNALDEISRQMDADDKLRSTSAMLSEMLCLPAIHRIESYDISNLRDTDIVASMVVFQNGKPRRSEYKRFMLNDMDHADDYASMRQVLHRRFIHYLNGDKGFADLPDLLLVDGGATHTQTAVDALNELDIKVPVFGMVKDNRHRTRALINKNGEEIRIDSKANIFSFIGSIQEETHRFAIAYHRNLRSKRLKYSELDKISGIGPKRKTDLLNAFHSISAIKEQDVEQLKRVLPQNAAEAVFNHFHSK